jgi:hypothetical protein
MISSTSMCQLFSISVRSSHCRACYYGVQNQVVLMCGLRRMMGSWGGTEMLESGIRSLCIHSTANYISSCTILL